MYIIYNKNTQCINSVSTVYDNSLGDDFECAAYQPEWSEEQHYEFFQTHYITDGAHFFIDGEIIVDSDLQTKRRLEEQRREIRISRQYECFNYINRGQLWYNRLTSEQLSELDIWYESWLNAPETLIVPEKPKWLE